MEIHTVLINYVIESVVFICVDFITYEWNSNETTFVDINSTSLPEVTTSLPKTSTSLKETITLSAGTAISAEPDGIVRETTNFNSNATTPPFLSPITELGNRSEYFRHYDVVTSGSDVLLMSTKVVSLLFRFPSVVPLFENSIRTLNKTQNVKYHT
jgi:hypothetical protein